MSSYLQQVIREMAYTGGNDIGAVPGTLFGGGVVRRPISNKKLRKAMRMPIKQLKQTIEHRNKWKWHSIHEVLEDPAAVTVRFDASDVRSKLVAAEKKVKNAEDTVPFGMEDEEGNIVKVYVKAEQADDFEAALAALLAGESLDDDDDETINNVEIAEILFKLKDTFDIIDVEWPQIKGDENEEEQPIKPPKGRDQPDDMPDDTPPLDDSDAPEDKEPPEELDDIDDADDEMLKSKGPDMEADTGLNSTLQQIIDMMKADAEARKSESEARVKEAEARVAEANAAAAAAKVKQEEEILDMETFNKQQKTEQDEAKRLAQLAKYKHQRASDMETKLAQDENEESSSGTEIPSHMTKDQLLHYLLKHLQANE